MNNSFHQYISQQLLYLQSLENYNCKIATEVIECLANIRGSIIFVGVGKSGIVSQKLSATMNSLSVPSQYLHATEMMHGDLGRLTSHDAVIVISRSGNTDEVIEVLKLIASVEIPTIGIVNNAHTAMHTHCRYTIELPKATEVDTEGLVPTTSTTMQMIVGDALALSVADRRGYSKDAFSKVHPGGNLGRRLSLKVGDVLHDDPVLKLQGHEDISQIIYAISKGRVGACVVVDNDKILGVITDGDLRRMLSRGKVEGLKANDIMTRSPKNIDIDESLFDALSIMEAHKISQLIVVDGSNYCGFIHIHDCIESGIL